MQKGVKEKEAALQRCSKEMCSENMQQIYTRTLILTCDFNINNFIEITLWYGCSPVNLLHIF